MTVSHIGRALDSFLKDYYFCIPSITREFVTRNPLTEGFVVTVYKFVDFLKRDFSANKKVNIV